MKKCLFLLLPLLLFGCMQTKRDQSKMLTNINIIDRNGMTETVGNSDRLRRYQGVNFLDPQPYEKVMRVYGRNSRGDIPAYITSYHPNGEVKQYLEIVNNRAFGTYREWHENGRLKMDLQLIGGEGDIGSQAEKTWLIDGESKAWDEEGNLAAVVPYSKGQLHGDSLYYHTNGKVWKRIPFNNGKIDGVYEIYCDDGTKLQTVPYSKGQCLGKAYRYWDGEKIAAEELYSEDGQLMEGCYYSREGKVVCRVENGSGTRAIFGKRSVSELHEYREGVEEGKVEVLDEKGLLVATYFLKDGEKNGEEIEYLPQRLGQKKPRPRLSIQWVDGQIQGKVRTWYANGNMESQRDVSENKKNGHSTAWYEDGSLMLIEEYEYDTLKSGKYFRQGEKIPVSEIRDGKGIATLFDSTGNFIRKINYQSGRPIP